MTPAQPIEAPVTTAGSLAWREVLAMATATDLLRIYGDARRHVSAATWSALLALATEPYRWHSRRDMLAKMPWLSGLTGNVTYWRGMLIPAIDLGAVRERPGAKGYGPGARNIPISYRITAKGLSLLGL